MNEQPNPYEAPPSLEAQLRADRPHSVRISLVKWSVATVGALLVTSGALLALLLIPKLLLPAGLQNMSVIAMYAVALPLALTAGVLSFRSTLRHYQMRE